MDKGLRVLGHISDFSVNDTLRAKAEERRWITLRSSLRRYCRALDSCTYKDIYLCRTLNEPLMSVSMR